MTLGLILLVLVVFLYFLLRPGRTPDRAGPQARPLPGVVDPDQLAAAEEELRQLDAGATPEDAEEKLGDWGPGTPKKP